MIAIGVILVGGFFVAVLFFVLAENQGKAGDSKGDSPSGFFGADPGATDGASHSSHLGSGNSHGHESGHAGVDGGGGDAGGGGAD